MPAARTEAFQTGQALIAKCKHGKSQGSKTGELEAVLVVDQDLCPADKSQAAEGLRLDLDGDVKVLSVPEVSDRISFLVR